VALELEPKLGRSLEHLVFQRSHADMNEGRDRYVRGRPSASRSAPHREMKCGERCLEMEEACRRSRGVAERRTARAELADEFLARERRHAETDSRRHDDELRARPEHR